MKYINGETGEYKDCDNDNMMDYIRQTWLPINDKECMFTGFIGIPKLNICELNSHVYCVNGHDYDVVKIDNSAFCGYDFETIIIPSTVKNIGNHVFKGCEKLKNIRFKGKLESLGTNSFANCVSLEKFSFDDFVFKEFSLFSHCISLKEVTLSKDQQIIPNLTFEYCYSLKSINGIENIKHIELGSFLLCKSLETIDLSSCVRIDSMAFFRCFNLKNITFGNKLNRVCSNAFNSCSVEEIRFPKTQETLVIENNAFSNCLNLKRVIFENSNILINAHTFTNCDNLKEIIVNGKVIKNSNPYMLKYSL